MNIKPTPYFMLKCLFVFMMATALSGCFRSESYRIKQFDTQEKICRKCTPWSAQYYDLENMQVTVNKPVDLCRKREVLYVKMHNHSSLSSAYFEDSVMVTLEENELFHKIVTREPTVYINVEPYSPETLEDGRLWYDTDDPLSIGQIKKLYPYHELLVLEVHLQEFSDREPIVVTLNLIDPADGQSVVFWRETRPVWYRTEDMQTVSVLTDFNDWLNNVEENFCDRPQQKIIIREEE